ncbi:hypothetical protein F5146DRAFT_132385 [Armillaria mellea]|nr:hypothetical protein F5146DRAFT_132385 [Armillaria mellea]
MTSPQLKDLLSFGEGQLFSSQDLYNRIINSPSVAHALNVPDHGASFQIEIKDPDSTILRNDLYFPLLLAFLKDERVPITSMQLKGLNWSNFLNPPAFRLALGRFLHVCDLHLTSTTCSKYDMKCLVTSLPKLARLFLEGCKLQGESGSVTRAFSQGSALEQICIDVLDGDYGVWDFLISPESPVSLSALRRIFITGDGTRVASDRTMVHRIQTLLDRTQRAIQDFDISDINMDEGLQPLHVENVESLSFTINLTDAMDQMYCCVQWWTATFLALPAGTQFERVTVEIAVDQHRVENGSMPLPDSRLIFWKALDEALCRPELHISELHFFVHAKHNPDSMYLNGYNYSGVMHWLCMHCLPRCIAKYESDFMLADEDYEAVDLSSLWHI